MVGSSGSAAIRLAWVLASATRAPARTCGSAVEAGMNITGTRPVMTSFTACELPV